MSFDQAGLTCPSCQAPVSPEQNGCPECGHSFLGSAGERDKAPRHKLVNPSAPASTKVKLRNPAAHSAGPVPVAVVPTNDAFLGPSADAAVGKPVRLLNAAALTPLPDPATPAADRRKVGPDGTIPMAPADVQNALRGSFGQSHQAPSQAPAYAAPPSGPLPQHPASIASPTPPRSRNPASKNLPLVALLFVACGGIVAIVYGGRQHRQAQENEKTIPLPPSAKTPVSPTPPPMFSATADPTASAPIPSPTLKTVPPNAQEPPTLPTLDEATRNRLKNATVVVNVKMIGQKTSLGSGFFVTEDGLLVTNHHVIEGALLSGQLSIQLYGTSEDINGALCVAYDKRRDLALIRAPNVKAPSVLRLYSGARVPETTPVIVIGHPREEYWSITLGAITGYRELKGQPFYGTDARIEPGNSGGPVLLRSSNEVIGVSDWKVMASNLNYAIPVEVLADFIRSNAKNQAKPCNQ